MSIVNFSLLKDSVSSKSLYDMIDCDLGKGELNIQSKVLSITKYNINHDVNWEEPILNTALSFMKTTENLEMNKYYVNVTIITIEEINFFSIKNWDIKYPKISNEKIVRINFNVSEKLYFQTFFSFTYNNEDVIYQVDNLSFSEKFKY